MFNLNFSTNENQISIVFCFRNMTTWQVFKENYSYMQPMLSSANKMAFTELFFTSTFRPDK